jgi:hypothetical protein
MTVPEPRSIAIFVLVYLVSLGVVLKKRVFRSMRNYLGERIVGDWFLKVTNCSYNALRLPIRPVAEAQIGSGAAKGLLSREGAHFLGGIGMWGMRECRLLVE